MGEPEAVSVVRENRTALKRLKKLRDETNNIPAGYDLNLEGVVMEILDILIDREEQCQKRK